MPTLEQVQTQLKAIDGVSRFMSLKEIRELPSILWEDEQVERLTSGMYNGGNGVLVATNKRLIFIDKGLFYGLRVEDFSYDKITSIQYKTGLILGEITIFASGNKADITHIEKGLARNFAEHVRARTTSVSKSVVAPKDPPALPSEDFISRLERLAALKAQGILTDEEFQSQKSKILSSSM